MEASEEIADTEPKREMMFQGEEHSQKVTEQLFVLFEEKKFSDVVLKANDDKEFPCHRVVLAAASSYFEAMFSSGMVESTSPTVELEKMDSDILSSLIRYMYSGRLTITAENVQRLVESIKPLDLPEIITGCEDFMIEEVCPANCLGFKRFADLYELEWLKEAAQSTMLKEFSQVVRSDEFGELSVQEITEYISDSKLKVKTEDPVFEAVCIWVRVDPVNREAMFPQIAAEIRFPYCSKTYLSSTVVPCPYMSNSECASYLQEACTYHMLPEGRSRVAHSPRLKGREDFQNCGAMVLFGGLNNDGVKGQDDAYLCPETDTWEPITPFSKKDLRCYAAVAFQNGIFVTGGEEKGELKKDCFLYDFTLHEWRDMPPMMEGRSCHASVVHSGHVYVLGGTILSGAGNSVEVYSKSPRRWIPSKPMPKPLTNPLALRCGQYIFVTSGICISGPSVSTMVYNTVWDRWEHRKDMPKPVKCGGIIALQDKIYVVGGELPSCLSYNMAEDAWTILTPPNHAHACAATYAVGATIRIWGGRDSTGQVTGTVEIYDVEKDTWSPSEDISKITGHNFFYVDFM